MSEKKEITFTIGNQLQAKLAIASGLDAIHNKKILKYPLAQGKGDLI